MAWIPPGSRRIFDLRHRFGFHKPFKLAGKIDDLDAPILGRSRLRPVGGGRLGLVGHRLRRRRRRIAETRRENRFRPLLGDCRQRQRDGEGGAPGQKLLNSRLHWR